MCRKLLTTLLLGLSAPVAALFVAPGALASSGQVISDCNTNGYLSGHYSHGDLQGALNSMPADVKEYTNCYDVVSRALLASAAGGGATPGAGGGSPSNSAPGATGPGARAGNGKRRGAAGVSTRGVYSNVLGSRGTAGGNGGTVALDRSGVRPGALSASTALPGPLIVVLVLLGIAAFSGAGLALRRRLATRRGVLTRHGA